MSNLFSFKQFKDISIAKKLYFAVGIMALLIAVELFTLWFAVSTLSSVRAYVGGEGLWSKGQKDAVYHLQKYGRTYNEQDYLAFREFMKVPLGDNKTRLELSKAKPDLDIARQGFVEGGNHPQDVDGMIKLFSRFHNIYYINKAIIIWGQAAEEATKLFPLASELHKEISSENPSQNKIDELLNQVAVINEKLTKLEDSFSYTLGEGSRWLENIILKLLLAVALTVEISGLLLTISVSRGIQRGLNEIIRASKRIAKGDFTAKAKSYSNDEIGILANSFNQMTEDLAVANESLKNYAHKLERSNESLEQFAYVASHDLQEPLRTISNFVELLEVEQKNSSPGASGYMKRISNAAGRMRTLIHDMLHFSQLGKYRTLEEVDCGEVVKDILSDMELVINESHAKISVGPLPVITTAKTEMQQLFQNLVNNAIKYRRTNLDPEIEIKAERRKNEWLFSIKDNGIGIDNAFKEKIFVIFQRLHSHNEYSGTGIGLATCKKIIELNNGKIWVESVPGKGSTFYFTLPGKNSISK